MRFELLATTTFVIILASGCSFGKYKCKSMQSEAKANLKTIQAGMVMAHTEEGRYPRVFEGTVFAPEGQYYDYKVIKVDDNTGFEVEAVGKGDMEGDRWKIDQLGQMTAVADKCQ